LRRSAWIAGGLSLVAATCSYYSVGGEVFGMHAHSRLVLVWSVTGAVAGSALGLAGWIARYDRARRSMAWAILAGSLLGEGAHLIWFTSSAALHLVGVAELSLAACVALRCTSASPRRRLTTAVASSTALITLMGFVLIGHMLRA
jgi:hypothetical protein